MENGLYIRHIGKVYERMEFFMGSSNDPELLICKSIVVFTLHVLMYYVSLNFIDAATATKFQTWLKEFG